MAEQIADLGARLPAPDSRLPLFFLADFLDDRIDLLAERIDLIVQLCCHVCYQLLCSRVDLLHHETKASNHGGHAGDSEAHKRQKYLSCCWQW